MQVQEQTSTQHIAPTGFNRLCLNQKLLKGLTAHGYEIPTQVQEKSLPLMKKEKDFVLVGRNGLGKRTALILGALSLIQPSNPSCQVIILVPNRNEVPDYYQFIIKVSEYLNISVRMCMSREERRLSRFSLKKANTQVVIGTLPEIRYLVERRIINLLIGGLNFLAILDMDELISRGLIDEIHQFLEECPCDVAIYTSTTQFPNQMTDFITKFTRNPEIITINTPTLPFDLRKDRLTNFYLKMQDDDHKLTVLTDHLQLTSCLIYVANAIRAGILIARLRENNLQVETVEEGASLIRFYIQYNQIDHNGILVSTSLEQANSIHGKLYSDLIINYDMPMSSAIYFKRACWGSLFSRRTIVNLVNRDEEYLIEQLRRKGIAIQEIPLFK